MEEATMAVLYRHRIGWVFADEMPRPIPRHYSTTPDTGCSLVHRCVFVPRRRRTAQHYAELLHEAAHLLCWEETGKRPAKHGEPMACTRALAEARMEGAPKTLIEVLEA
jgi:hypothetical protein